MRSEFEKLPQIESHLHNVVFDEGSNEYLAKKMGYLPFEFSEWFVNGSWVMYQHQQSKVDDLQLRIDALSLALDKIAYPIPHMQKEADMNGCELNGYWAVKMSEDHTYSKDIARKALEKEQALKGGGK